LASYPIGTRVADGAAGRRNRDWSIGFECGAETEARRGKGVCWFLKETAPPLFGAALIPLSCVLSWPDSAYLDGVSLPDFELLSDPEDEHLCATLMQQ